MYFCDVTDSIESQYKPTIKQHYHLPDLIICA